MQKYVENQVEWTSDDIKVLGIKISHNDMELKNYKIVENKVKTVLNAWSNRNLSLLGRSM